MSKHTPGPWIFENRDGDHPLNDQDGWGCDGLWAVNGGFILGSGTGWDGAYQGPIVEMSSPKLKPGIRYRVIKGNSTFRVGDHIWIEPDGAIMCREASGWICAEDVMDAIKGISVEEVRND